jgi:hypothetical protein
VVFQELLNTLKYVRPGGGYVPPPTMTLFQIGNVNGFTGVPGVYSWLKVRPVPAAATVGVSGRDAVPVCASELLPAGVLHRRVPAVQRVVAHHDHGYSVEF